MGCRNDPLKDLTGAEWCSPSLPWAKLQHPQEPGTCSIRQSHPCPPSLGAEQSFAPCQVGTPGHTELSWRYKLEIKRAAKLEAGFCGVQMLSQRI